MKSIQEGNIDQTVQQRVDARYKLMVLYLSAALVAYIAFLNPIGVSPDYQVYVDFFDCVRFYGISMPYAYEPGFKVLILLLAGVLPTNTLAFSVVVLITSSFKLVLLYRLHASYVAYALAMVLFFFKFFPLQDYNQVRIALALGLLMLTYYYLIIKPYYWLAVLFAFVSVFFHYSVLALIPFVFALKFDLAIKRKYIFGATAAVFLGLATSAYVVIHILMNVIPRLDSYADIFYHAVSSPLSPVFYPEFFLLVVSIYFWDDLTDNMKRIVGLQLVGFAIFYGLYDFGVIGTRLREAISIFWLFYVADFSRVTLQLKAAIGLFVLMNVALGSYLFYFSNFLS